LNFHLVILCNKGNCDASVGHHNFAIQPSSISIIQPHTVFSMKHFSEDFNAHFLLFKSDFVKKGFVKSDIMEELLFQSPHCQPIYDRGRDGINDNLNKFEKNKYVIDNMPPVCIEVPRLYILQILYDYNRTCEICRLNSDKLINMQYQVMYEFRK